MQRDAVAEFERKFDAREPSTDDSNRRVCVGPCCSGELAVELGALSGENVTVTSGLSTGDWIAVSGVHQLREGMRVRRYES